MRHQSSPNRLLHLSVPSMPLSPPPTILDRRLKAGGRCPSLVPRSFIYSLFCTRWYEITRSFVAFHSVYPSPASWLIRFTCRRLRCHDQTEPPALGLVATAARASPSLPAPVAHFMGHPCALLPRRRTRMDSSRYSGGHNLPNLDAHAN